MASPAPAPSSALKLFAALTVVALALQLWGLGSRSLWQDEGMTWWEVAGDWATMWRHTLGDRHHPPLYHLLLWGWTHVFGLSEVALRSPSVVAATLGIPLFAWLCLRLADEASALLATALLVVSPMWLEFGRMARPYAMFGTAVIASYAALALWLEKPTGPRLGAYLAALACAVGLHNYSVFHLAAHGMIVVASVRRGGTSTRSAFMIGGGWAAILLPWALYMTRDQAPDDEVGFWVARPTLGSTLHALSSLVAQAGPARLVLLLIVLASIGLVFGGRAGRWKARPVLVLVVAWAVVPIVLPLGYSMVGRVPLFVARYAIGSLPAILLLLAWGALRFQRFVAAAAVGTALLAVAVAGTVAGTRVDPEPWRDALARLDARALAGDAVFVGEPSYAFVFNYYHHGPGTLTPASFSENPAVRPKAWLGNVSSALEKAPRVWILALENDVDAMQPFARELTQLPAVATDEEERFGPDGQLRMFLLTRGAR
jgi:4-amino-4-deoxy-L-arabinose transferase-like glycosyltransferase